MTVKYLQTKSTGLSYGISRSSTTIQLKQLLKLDGTSVSASDVGDLLYGTFAPGTSREEIFSIVGANVTVESDGKITITSVTRGLKEVSPYTTGGYSCDHPAGEVVIFGNNPQVYQWLKDYIDSAIVSGGVPATDAVPGLVIEGTQAQVDAGTTQETYNAQNYDLFVRPDTLRAKKYHDAVASATGTDAYAITVVPAITAYATGQEFTFIADVANTTGATLAVSGLTAKDIKKDVSTALATGDILAGQTVKVIYDGTNMQLVSKSSLDKQTDVQTFTSSSTWTKPTGAKSVEVICIGAGGGGAGGRDGGGQGGAGGGGGAYNYKLFISDILSSTETVTVGTGGTGGVGGSGGGGANYGTAGANGGMSSFGNFLKAGGGGGGECAIASGGGGGSVLSSASTKTAGSPSGTTNGIGGQSAAGSSPSSGYSAEFGGGSGGSGTASSTHGGSSINGAGAGGGGGDTGSNPGGNGGTTGSYSTSGGGAGGASGVAGTNGADYTSIGKGYCGAGGGGAGAGGTSPAKNGGNGGIYGGGGGGGGGGTGGGGGAGNGGNGGNGVVIVITYF